jgi:prevent-host-death family protein
MKIQEIGAFHAKTHLSELLDKVRQGQSFYITKRGHAVAELRPVAHVERRARFGCDKGRVDIGADFDAPLPELKDYTQ